MLFALEVQYKIEPAPNFPLKAHTNHLRAVSPCISNQQMISSRSRLRATHSQNCSLDPFYTCPLCLHSQVLPGMSCRRDYEPIGLKFIYKLSSLEADLGMLILYVLLMSHPSLTSTILYSRKELAGTWKLLFFLLLK